jgi:hypothetical protein
LHGSAQQCSANILYGFLQVLLLLASELLVLGLSLAGLLQPTRDAQRIIETAMQEPAEAP